MRAGPMMLQVAARHADGLNVAWSFSPGDCRRIFEELDAYADKYGREHALKRSIGVWTRIFEDSSQMDAYVERAARAKGMSVDAYLRRTSGGLYGTPDEVEARLGEYADVDIEHLIMMFPHGDEVHQLELLADIFGSVL